MILIKKHTVNECPPDTRLVDYAIDLFEELPTKNSVKKALKTGALQLKGLKATTGTFVNKDMEIELYDLQQNPPKPYLDEVEVVYEDDELVVVNKPSGLPTSGNQFRTLENILVHQISLPSDSKYLFWPKPVHRLDSATSGLVLVAKSIEARYLLGQAFENQQIKKVYHALVMGNTPGSGALTSQIEKRPAKTQFEKIDQVKSLKNNYLTLLRLYPETGRTHQLRIHCMRAGFPIYGDQLYAEKTIRHKGMFLAATSLSFHHPITKRELDMAIDLPDNFYSRMKNEQKRWEKYNT